MLLGVAIVLVFLATVVEGFLGVYQSITTPVFVVAVASVVARHVIQPRALGNTPPTG